MYRNHLVAMNRLIITGIGIRLVKKGREGKKGDRAKFSWTNHLNFFKGNATPLLIDLSLVQKFWLLLALRTNTPLNIATLQSILHCSLVDCPDQAARPCIAICNFLFFASSYNIIEL